jgi:hypothetical protein
VAEIVSLADAISAPRQTPRTFAERLDFYTSVGDRMRVALSTKGDA